MMDTAELEWLSRTNPITTFGAEVAASDLSGRTVNCHQHITPDRSASSARCSKPASEFASHPATRTARTTALHGISHRSAPRFAAIPA